MKPDLEQLYIASYDAKGGFWTEPAIDFLRRANEECVEVRPAERHAIGVCDGMLEALRLCKAAKAMRKKQAEARGQKSEVSEKQEPGGSTFTGGPATYPEPRSAAEVIR